MSRMPKLTYANVMSTIAVFLALSMGTAWAATKLGNNSVRSRHIAPGQVKPGDIGANAVRSAAIADDAVGSSELSPNSVGTSEIANNGVGSSEIAADSVGQSDIVSNGVAKAEIASDAVGVSEIINGVVGTLHLDPTLAAGVSDGINSGKLALNSSPSNVTVSSTSWPTPANGQITATWSQPANTLDVIMARARLVFTPGCTSVGSGTNGIEMKIVDASDGNRVISADSHSSTEDGNGFTADTSKAGVTYQTTTTDPVGSQRVEYTYLPIELSDFVTGGSAQTRTIRFMFRKRGCGGGSGVSASNPQVTNVRIYVMRYR